LKSSPWHLFFCFVFLAATAGEARAALLGDTIKPFASVTQMYDSNVFRVNGPDQARALTGDDRLGDFITVAAVGTGVHYTVSREELNLLLEKDFLRYSHYAGQNADRDMATGNLGLVFLDKLRINLDGSYSRIPEPRSDYQNPGLNTVTSYGEGLAVAYETPMGVGMQAAYRRTTVDYSLQELKPNEHSSDRYEGTLFYRLSATSRTYVSYQREYISYGQNLQLASQSVNNDSTSDSVRLGLDKTFSPKTAVSCYLGYLNRRHDAFPARDFDGVTGKAEITYGLTARLGLAVNGGRQLNEESYADWIYSVNDWVGAALVYAVTEKIKGSLSDRLSWKRFKEIPGSGVAARSDRQHEINAGAEWAPLERLTVSFGYQYSARSSNLDTFDFTDHTVMSSLAYRF